MQNWIKWVTPYLTILSFIIGTSAMIGLQIQKKRINESIEISKTINSKLGIDSISSIDSLKNIVLNLEYEKETYTQNLDLLTNWFIFFESILFGIFFLVGYGFFDDKINQYKQENLVNNEKERERNVIHEKELIEIKKVVYRGEGNSCVLLSEYCKKNDHLFDSLKYCIAAAVYLYRYKKLKGDGENNLITPIQHNLSNAIDILTNINQSNIFSFKANNEIKFEYEFELSFSYLDELIISNSHEVSKLASKLKAELYELKEKLFNTNG